MLKYYRETPVLRRAARWNGDLTKDYCAEEEVDGEVCEQYYVNDVFLRACFGVTPKALRLVGTSYARRGAIPLRVSFTSTGVFVACNSWASSGRAADWYIVPLALEMWLRRFPANTGSLSYVVWLSIEAEKEAKPADVEAWSPVLRYSTADHSYSAWRASSGQVFLCDDFLHVVYGKKPTSVRMHVSTVETPGSIAIAVEPVVARLCNLCWKVPVYGKARKHGFYAACRHWLLETFDEAIFYGNAQSTQGYLTMFECYDNGNSPKKLTVLPDAAAYF